MPPGLASPCGWARRNTPGKTRTGPAGRERQHAEHDVRIGALGVRMGMMPAVLTGPPAVTEPGAEVGACDTEEVVGPAGTEDLAVPGIVAEKADLGKGNGQEDRDS